MLLSSSKTITQENATHTKTYYSRRMADVSSVYMRFRRPRTEFTPSLFLFLVGSGSTIAVAFLCVVLFAVTALFLVSRCSARQHHRMVTETYKEGDPSAKKKAHRHSVQDKIKALQNKRNRIVTNYNAIGGLLALHSLALLSLAAMLPYWVWDEVQLLDEYKLPPAGSPQLLGGQMSPIEFQYGILILYRTYIY